jgi:hypothetical protein
MPRNVFVLGLDDLNLSSLLALPDAGRYRFHQLLTIEELQQGHEIPLRELLDKATVQLEAFDGPIDAIVGYWDFPISSMVPLLCRRFGLASPSLESVVKCEHKYWARVEQQKVIDELPRFTAVDPYDDESVERIDLRYPYWLKPVKAFSSALAHRIEGPEDVGPAIEAIRKKGARVGKPFDWVLHQVDLPPEIDEIGGDACIAEEDVSGRQFTVEGYSNGGVVAHGVVDSILLDDVPSFERFQYPSLLPEHVQERATDISRRVMRQFGFEGACFNVEFFWQEDSDALYLLEVNPRHSQSHAKLFEYVDGISNHKLMVELALGETPSFEHGRGPHKIAAKWFVRSRRDGVVTRSPTQEEVAEIERAVPGCAIHLVAKKGDLLSELHDQDTFSYKLANVYVGADSEEELVEKYRRCADALPYEFDDG